jgi:hypothetical protein
VPPESAVPRVPRRAPSVPGTRNDAACPVPRPLKGGTGRGTPSEEENRTAIVPRRRALARSASRERQAAALLGTRRVRRARFESKPDLEPVTLACGTVLQPEVKTRKKLPALITTAIAQATGYGPRGSVPVAVLSATGEEPLIVVPLRAFCRIAGLVEARTEDGQLTLPTTRRSP